MTERTGLLNIQLRNPENKEVWHNAEKAVARALNTDPDKLTRAEVARELSEAYTGRDALGEWKHD